MLDTNDILETIQMISDENLDVRTVTMGISLLDCADPDGRKACEEDLSQDHHLRPGSGKNGGRNFRHVRHAHCKISASR